ncbi:hypothetical protein RUM43_002534 [Polyplax serrata]|uniref:hydroxyisourate hydrolase n=1 Tax=Polyplax serrata TaxID=468196 RepID=A0AAN8RVZ3_POLSC
MAENNSIRLVTKDDSSDENEEKYEIYEAGSDMLYVIGLDNKQALIKNPRLKPRYKQSYREAWESMRDFKGWLTSVPGNNTKAYCKLCKKELHCHRLSLLKHKVTFKHHQKEEQQKLMKIIEKNEDNPKNVTEEKIETPEQDISNSESTAIKVDSENPTAGLTPNILRVEKPDLKDISNNKQEEEGQTKLGTLSTHVLDISKGTAAALVHVVLYKLIDGRWTLIQEGITDDDGRYNYCVSNDNELPIGRYKLHFDVDKYFEKQNQETIFPFIEIAFDIKDASSHYHVPVLLSPFGYSTYRGS